MNSGRAAQCLHWLQREFPLEARVATLPVNLLRAYRKILESWSKGVPPSIRIADAAVLRELAGSDAILIEEAGISCYPFSACDTGIRVAVGQKSVNAMCAIDALAIPGIMAGIGQVEANCVACRTRLSWVVDKKGVIGSGGGHVAVAWGEKPAGSSCSGRSLCPQIRFQCVGCSAPTEGHLLDIVDGAAVGIAFFSFQRQLLQTSGA